MLVKTLEHSVVPGTEVIEDAGVVARGAMGLQNRAAVADDNGRSVAAIELHSVVPLDVVVRAKRPCHVPQVLPAVEYEDDSFVVIDGYVDPGRGAAIEMKERGWCVVEGDRSVRAH